MLVFAVTDQHIVLKLEIISRTEVEDFDKIQTQLIEPISTHGKAHHRHYFKTLYVNKSDNELTSSSVFYIEQNAKDYAIKNINEDIESSEMKLASLHRKRDLLKS